MDRPSRLSQDENRLLEDYYAAYYRMPRHNTVMRDVETPYGLRFMVLHMREKSISTLEIQVGKSPKLGA